jgi:hypothetical protein
MPVLLLPGTEILNYDIRRACNTVLYPHSPAPSSCIVQGEVFGQVQGNFTFF